MQEDLQAGDNTVWVQWSQEIGTNRPVIGALVDEANYHPNLSPNASEQTLFVPLQSGESWDLFIIIIVSYYYYC